MARNIDHWNRVFARLSENSDKEIYEELSLSVRVRGLRPGIAYSVHGDAEHGREWLDKKLAKARARICNNKKLRNLIRTSEYTQRDLFLVLVDVLSALALYIPVGTIAMILARGGLKKLCPQLSGRR